MSNYRTGTLDTTDPLATESESCKLYAVLQDQTIQNALGLLQEVVKAGHTITKDPNLRPLIIDANKASPLGERIWPSKANELALKLLSLDPNKHKDLVKLSGEFTKLYADYEKALEECTGMKDKDRVPNTDNEKDKQVFTSSKPPSCPTPTYKWGVKFTYTEDQPCKSSKGSSSISSTTHTTNSSNPSTNSPIPLMGHQIDIGGRSENSEVNLGGVVRDWYLTLLPAMQSVLPKQGARDIPNSMPGIQFRAVNRIVKHFAPGMGSIYQNMGIDSLHIVMVGCFTGDGGLAPLDKKNPFEAFNRLKAPAEVAQDAAAKAAQISLTRALTRRALYGGDSVFLDDACPGQCPPSGVNEKLFTDFDYNPEGKRLGDIAGRLDAYQEFTSFYKMAYTEGRHLEVEINLRKNRDGLRPSDKPFNIYDPEGPALRDPLRNEEGNPRFKGLVRRIEVYAQYSDRVWYLIEFEVTDHGDVNDSGVPLKLNLTNVVSQKESEVNTPPAPSLDSITPGQAPPNNNALRANPKQPSSLGQTVDKGVELAPSLGQTADEKAELAQCILSSPQLDRPLYLSRVKGYLHINEGGSSVLTKTQDPKSEVIEVYETPNKTWYVMNINTKQSERGNMNSRLLTAIWPADDSSPSLFSNSVTITKRQVPSLLEGLRSGKVISMNMGNGTYLYVDEKGYSIKGPDPDQLEQYKGWGMRVSNPTNTALQVPKTMEDAGKWRAFIRRVNFKPKRENCVTSR